MKTSCRFCRCVLLPGCAPTERKPCCVQYLGFSLPRRSKPSRRPTLVLVSEFGESVRHKAKLQQWHLCARYLVFFRFEDEVLGLEVPMADVVLIVNVLNRPTGWADRTDLRNSVVAGAGLSTLACAIVSTTLHSPNTRFSPQYLVHDLCRIPFAIPSLFRFRLGDYAVEQFTSGAQLRHLVYIARNTTKPFSFEARLPLSLPTRRCQMWRTTVRLEFKLPADLVSVEPVYATRRCWSYQM